MGGRELPMGASGNGASEVTNPVMENVALQTLTSPVILFFLLGMGAAAARSELAIPEAMAKGMSLYLMAAIGLKGGMAMAESGVDSDVATALLAGIAASFAIPFGAYALLRGFGRLNRIDAGAVAAHYGSVSVVTFVTAGEILKSLGTAPAGFMVAVLAVMETPAILSGLYLARRGKARAAAEGGSELWRDVFLNPSVVLLLGSFAIGWISDTASTAAVKPFFDGLFKGILCLFLLDMGLIAARRLIQSRAMNWRLVSLAIFFPLVNGAVGVLAGTAIGLDVGSAAAFGVLCASASYIAVPAAMRLALPQADPGIYLTMSLSLSFPFNLIVNIGLIAWLARTLAAG